jgi:membrane protease YdiL (CAAX protease family)
VCAFASGVIWCAWHFPALLWFGYGATGTPKIYQMACFSLMVVASAVVMAWLRIRSGSIWPAVVMHAVHNTAVQMFFDRITANTARTAYFTAEFGIALGIPLAALAIYCIRKLRTCERRESELPMYTAALAK